jgi:mannose-1-phosphate guanylyltransferase
MEKADNVYTIPSSFGWSDLGTWGSLFIESEKDENNNAINGNEIQIEDVQNCLIRMPKDKLLVAKGLDDYIIIDEEDVLLIYPKSKEQEIKKVVGEVGKNGGERFL